MLINANWWRLMLIDANWCWSMLTDADRCWLMLIDADWCLYKIQPGNLLSERTFGVSPVIFDEIVGPDQSHSCRPSEKFSEFNFLKLFWNILHQRLSTELRFKGKLPEKCRFSRRNISHFLLVTRYLPIFMFVLFEKYMYSSGQAGTSCCKLADPQSSVCNS